MTGKPDIILKAITENPGIRFRGIMRKTGLTNGVLSHHLERMERRNLIAARRRPGASRFYPGGTPESDFAPMAALCSPTTRPLVLALLRANELSFTQLVRRSKRSRSVASRRLTQLVGDGIVEVLPIGRTKLYGLADRERISRLLGNRGSGMPDARASNPADMINPLRL